MESRRTGQDMLREIKKVLRPEGFLVLIDFKRIEGVSKDFVLKMVRAGEGTFTDEFQNAGFELIERRDDMFEDNYLLRFRQRPAADKPTTSGKGKEKVGRTSAASRSTASGLEPDRRRAEIVSDIT